MDAAGAIAARVGQRQAAAERYRRAYGRYCWTVSSVADVKAAPFHILAAEGQVFDDRDHQWHMDVARDLSRAAGPAGPFIATRHRAVNLNSDPERAEAVDWWRELTAAGGEGMVVKPLSFTPPRPHIQPAVKVRGKDYLSIIYGPEYDLPVNIDRMRPRSVRGKGRLATREFALGLEGLHRFVAGEPLSRVHQCAYAVLALESAPVDPRL